MNRYYYDLHIHSCLSPCADNDSTPGNIAGMGTLNGLNIMALTDHNTCQNCPAFFSAAKRQGIIPIAGMELTTAEDIHAICLFEELEAAMEFDREIKERRILVRNRKDIFGDQFVVDENDEVIGEEEYLLSNATTVSIDDAVPLVEQYGGICYPAHIDREANGIVSVLGTVPSDSGFKIVEFHSAKNIAKYQDEFSLQNYRVVVSSDAHYLWDIKEHAEYFELDDEPYSSSLVRKRLFDYLKGR